MAVLALTLTPLTGLGEADPVYDAMIAAAGAVQTGQGVVQSARDTACGVEGLEPAFCGATEAWTAVYDGPGRSQDNARDMHVSPDGSLVYVGSMSRGDGTNYDYTVVAYDTVTGSEVWVARYDGTGSGYDVVNALTVNPEGTMVYVTGWSTGVGTRGDATTLAVNARTGETVWTARYDGPASAQDAASDVVVSPDGSTVFVAGYGIVNGNDDFLAIAYDAMTGAQKWLTRYDGPANGYDRAMKVGVSPDGDHVYVGGNSVDVGANIDYTTIAYDAATGSQVWLSRYNGPGSGADGIYALGVTPDGSSVIVAGASKSVGLWADYDFATLAIDAESGASQWVSRYNGVAGEYDVARALSISPDGMKVYVTGPSKGAVAEDYVTIAYNVATGLESWVAVYDGGSTDFAYGLGVSPDGMRVYVTGQSVGSEASGVDYMTLAYDATTGVESWRHSYASDGAGKDMASTLAVNPLGTAVYVSGSTATSIPNDMATVAYDVLGNPLSLVPE